MKKVKIEWSATKQYEVSSRGLTFSLSPRGTHVANCSGENIQLSFTPFNIKPGDQTVDELCQNLRYYVESKRASGYNAAAEVVEIDTNNNHYPRLSI